MSRPIALSDKSFLHGLNQDEVEIFDLLFVSNITPTFFVEVLGDLEKNDLSKKSQEDLVKNLSRKTPHHHPYVNINYHQLCAGDLLGHSVQMIYKPVVYAGKEVNIDGDTHIFNDISLEEWLFEKWSNGIFSEVERNIAKLYRDNLEAIPKINQPIIKVDLGQKFSCLEEIKIFSDSIIYGHKSRLHLIQAALDFFRIIPEHRTEIMKRWKKEGGLPLSEFAPYATFVMSVVFFFQIAVLKGFLSDEKRSNWIDLSYLYYLPFAEIFISKDRRFHERIVPLFFTSSNQLFICADKMKEDLKKLADYYTVHPKLGSLNLYELVDYPPVEGNFFISSIYDKISPGWREFAKDPIRVTPELNQEVGSVLNPILKTVEKKISEGLFVPAVNADEAKTVTQLRRIPGKRGRWKLMPENRKNME